MNISPSEIYHVTAMPCYDKKLEASRSDFYSSIHSTRDVDCVLTTGELDLLLQDLAFDPYRPAPGDDRPEPASTNLLDPLGSPWPELLDHPGTSSGSYLHTILSHISSQHPNPTRVLVRKIRESDDNVEYSLEDTITHEIIFKGTKCYGFRNLQNLVRKVGKETGIGKAGGRAGKLSAAVAARRRKARTGQGEVMTPTTDGSDVETLAAALGREEKKLDFVEVMACPGGCVNGGGQMKAETAPAATSTSVDEEGYPRPMEVDGVAAPPTPSAAPQGEEEMRWRWSTKDWVNKVEAIYWGGLLTPPPSPPLGRLTQSSDHEVADKLAEGIVDDMCGSDLANRWEFLRTRFRKVEGDVLDGGVSHEAVRW